MTTPTPADPDDVVSWNTSRFWVGGPVNRVVYRQRGDDPSASDQVVAVMDSKLEACLFAFLASEAFDHGNHPVKEWLEGGWDAPLPQVSDPHPPRPRAS
jgi:hypothetical protein